MVLIIGIMVKNMKTSDPLFSFVIPAHNEEGNLRWYYDQIRNFVQQHKLRYELIYVDDGSYDGTLDVIKSICKEDANAHFLSFSRNFGKEAALTAGFRRATGDAVICLDADGQYPLETIVKFIEHWKQGAEIVIGVRGTNPTEGIIARFGSRSFYAFLKVLDPSQSVVSKSTDFRLIDRKVINEYNKLTERNRIARNLIDWLGFKRVYVPFDALERHSGVATYSFRKRLKLAIDGIVKHSTTPLKLIGVAGVIISILSVFTALLIVVEKYILGDPLNLAITGSAILALFLSFMIGIVLLCQGLLALYLENVYHETQNRPLYIIREEQ